MSELFDQTQLRLLNQSLSRMMTSFAWPGSPKPDDIPAQNYAKALRIVINGPQTPAYLGMAFPAEKTDWAVFLGKPYRNLDNLIFRGGTYLSPLTPFQPAVVQ